MRESGSRSKCFYLAAAEAQCQGESEEAKDSGAWLGNNVGTSSHAGCHFGGIHGMIVNSKFVEGSIEVGIDEPVGATEPHVRIIEVGEIGGDRAIGCELYAITPVVDLAGTNSGVFPSDCEVDLVSKYCCNVRVEGFNASPGRIFVANFNSKLTSDSYKQKHPYVITQRVILKNVTTTSGNPYMFRDVRVEGLGQ